MLKELPELSKFQIFRRCLRPKLDSPSFSNLKLDSPSCFQIRQFVSNLKLDSPSFKMNPGKKFNDYIKFEEFRWKSAAVRISKLHVVGNILYLYLSFY